jgi:predicted helicase
MKKDFEINGESDKAFKIDELFATQSSAMAIHDYFYSEIGIPQTKSNQEFQKNPNLNPEIVSHIAKKLGLPFTGEEEDIPENSSPVCYANSDEVTEEFRIELPRQTFAAIDILDYVYAILYSSAYREKYKELFKRDFPQIPYPKSQFIFWQLVKLGKELRQIHLLECTVVEKLITTYPVSGNNLVGKVLYENERVYINHRIPSSSGIEELQYFGNVPELAWDFYTDGYQPAQDWLKDRIGKELSFDDILRYQQIIVALMETQRIIKEIDKIEIV